MPELTENSENQEEIITIEQAKRFLEASNQERDGWLTCAKRSWEEIKKTSKTGVLFSISPNSAKKKIKYPLWYSTWKLRKPIVYSRTPEPIGLDELEGKDPVGETAALMLERLAKNLQKRSNFDEPMLGARDDALITQFGQGRVYYESEDILEPEREYLQITQDEAGNQFYTNAAGQIMTADAAIMQDELGPYIVTDKLVAIANEKVCAKHVIFRDFLVDPCAYRWSDVSEIAFGYDYSVEEFTRIFGKAALADAYFPNERGSKKKSRVVRVWEYWNKPKKQMGYLTATGEKFLKKIGIEAEEGEDPIYVNDDKNGTVYLDPYKLEQFWPCVRPMVFDQPTDSFWPISEWYQYCDLIEEVHNIASNIFILSRATRIRALFDNSIPALQSLVNESNQADWTGIDNLLSVLTKAGGNIANVVAYLPIQPMIEGLQGLYQALEQRLEKFGQLSGTSDLLQGKGDQVERTYGEQQMRAKFAMNQIEPYQEDMQRFAKETLELMTELALKNFNDESLKQNIVPDTMSQEHQANYAKALELLKNDRKRRFRIDLETDSTIALNEQYDMAMRRECTQALTQALQTASQVIETAPMLAPPLIELTRNLAQGFRQGKLFVTSMDASLEAVLAKAEELAAQPPPPPPFDKDQAMANLKAQELQQNAEIAMAEMASRERVEMGKLNTQTYLESLANQLTQFKLQLEQGATVGQLQLEYQKLEASMMEAQMKLAHDRDALMVELRKIADKKEMEQFEAMVGDKFRPFELQLEQQKQQIDMYELKLREAEQALEAQNAQFNQANAQIDNWRQEMRLKLDARQLAHEMQKPPELPAITINMPEPKKKKKKLKVTKRNGEGDAEEYEQVETEE